jgi:hypothetical protein
MVRTVVGLLLVLHGVIHLIGFVVPWRIGEIRGFAYSTSALWGRVDLGDAGARILGAGWLLAAVAFVLAGAGVAAGAAWGLPLTMGAAAVSMVLCIMGSPAAIAGLVIDAAILISLAALQVFAGPL